jgi:hypothetical protein
MLLHSIRGVGIGQHLSREQYYKIRSKPVQDERLFNNFKLEIPDEVHTVDMSRGPQRNFDNSLKYINKGKAFFYCRYRVQHTKSIPRVLLQTDYHRLPFALQETKGIREVFLYT